jgi:hypothetical protein
MYIMALDRRHNFKIPLEVEAKNLKKKIRLGEYYAWFWLPPQIIDNFLPTFRDNLSVPS